MYARAENGKFVKGTQAGPGPSYAKRMIEIKYLLVNNTSDEEIELIRRALVQQCLTGNVRAIQEFFDRVAGRPEQTFTDNTPTAPDITVEQFEKALADLGYVKCPPDKTSTTLPPPPSDAPVTP